MKQFQSHLVRKYKQREGKKRKILCKDDSVCWMLEMYTPRDATNTNICYVDSTPKFEWHFLRSSMSTYFLLLCQPYFDILLLSILLLDLRPSNLNAAPLEITSIPLFL